MLRSLLLCSLIISLSACGAGEEEKQPALENSCSVDAVKVRDAAPVALAQAEAPGHRFIVKLKDKAQSLGARVQRTQRLAAGLSHGAAIREIVDNLSVVEMPEATTSAELERQLPAEEIEYVEPDSIVHASYTINDPKAGNQWAHATVGSSAAWDVSRGSSSVIVAVVDTGIDYDHEDLAANIWTNPKEIEGNGIDDDGNGFIDDIHGWNFVDDNNTPKADDSGSFHGTHVSGTIGAKGNNGIGVAGHAHKVKLMALKFLSKDGSGFTSDAVKAVHYAVDHGAKIINNSWGGSSKSSALSAAIDKARAKGVLFVVAAGNEGRDNDKVDSYPTNYPQDNLVRVAASDSKDRLASWSNYGAKKVDLAAPGVNIYSTKNGNSYQYLSGTSMATPLVSGVLATMIAARPDLSYKQIKGALLQTVDVKSNFRGKVLWNGRVNAAKALKLVASITSSWEPEEPPPVVSCD